jgi:hypothetical protein
MHNMYRNVSNVLLASWAGADTPRTLNKHGSNDSLATVGSWAAATAIAAATA